MALGARIIAFARAQQGSEVGDGECTTLVEQALLRAGARTADSFGDVAPDADYVWGTLVNIADVRPGDILQFRHYRVSRHIFTVQHLPDGEISQTQSADFDEREHHTAIVEQNFGGTISVLEQNVDPGGRVVQRGRVETASRTYTQIDPSSGEQMTTVVSVEGDVFAYRPQKAAPQEVAAAQMASSEEGHSRNIDRGY